MRLKLYQAPNIGAAMAMVRTELGPDALILGTRPVDGGVEVTAALEPASQPIAPLSDPKRVAALRWHGVPEKLIEPLQPDDLARALEAQFTFGSLPLNPGAAPLLLLGPPGAGKTLTVARLATRMVLAGQTPLVVSADGRRAGAADQLAAFTRLLGLTLIVADEPLTLARALTRRQGGCPVLIDTPGLDHNAPTDRAAAEELIAASCGEPALVLPTGLDSAEASEIAAGFKSLGARNLVATRIDHSRRLGGVVAAAGAGLAFTEAGIGPNAADGLCSLTPTFLAERLQAGRLAPCQTEALSLQDKPRTNPPKMQPLSAPLPPYIRPRQGQERSRP
jgi:flagellar biosynthesis protein FlhF